jgi:hypothetical protein
MRDFTVADWKIWLYRILVVLGCGLMVVSFALPWWQAGQFDAQSYTAKTSVSDAITIYGFGLRHNLVQLETYISSDETPLYQSVLAWGYIVVSVVLALASTYIKGLKGRLLLGVVGIGYIAYALAAIFMVISNRLATYGFALKGSSTVVKSGAIITMQADVTSGYYLACATGIFLVILSLLRILLERKKVI